jgi:hypothetical protein
MIGLFSGLLTRKPKRRPITRQRMDSHADPLTGQTELVTLIAGEVNPFLSAGLVPA